jgi:hypothetical protein
MASKSEMVAQYTALAQFLEAEQIEMLRKQIYTVLAEATGSRDPKSEREKILKPMDK